MEEKAEYEAWSDVSDGLALCPKEMAVAIEAFLRREGYKTITKYLDKGGSTKTLQAMFRHAQTPPGTVEYTPANAIITNDEAELMELRCIEKRHAEELAPRLLNG